MSSSVLRFFSWLVAVGLCTTVVLSARVDAWREHEIDEAVGSKRSVGVVSSQDQHDTSIQEATLTLPVSQEQRDEASIQQATVALSAEHTMTAQRQNSTRLNSVLLHVDGGTQKDVGQGQTVQMISPSAVRHVGVVDVLHTAENQTLGKAPLSSVLEYELHISTEQHLKKKVALVLIEAFGLGLCGVDRCYMGQVCCGVGKCASLGGLFVWFILDYFVVVFNCLSSAKEIDTVGIKGTFSGPDDVTMAFRLFFPVTLVIALGIGACVRFVYKA